MTTCSPDHLLIWPPDHLAQEDRGDSSIVWEDSDTEEAQDTKGRGLSSCRLVFLLRLLLHLLFHPGWKTIPSLHVCLPLYCEPVYLCVCMSARLPGVGEKQILALSDTNFF